MKELTILLFERLCLLLVIAFVLTRTSGFRSLLYKEFDMKRIMVHSFVFGVFGIVGTMAGVVIDPTHMELHQFVLNADSHQFVVSLSLVPIVIAGLLGGPHVGLLAGIIAGTHLFFIGGIGWLANVMVNPLTGLLAGWTARFFSQERVIAPFKALFIGVFPPILQMQLLLIINPAEGNTVQVVDAIGLPLVLSNSLAIAIFTAMIGIVLKEQENEAAAATKRAITIVEEALPFMKKDTEQEIADGIADLLYDRLGLAAVSVTNKREVISFRGIGADHHQKNDKIRTSLARRAMATNEMQIGYSKADIHCEHSQCPLDAAIIIPITETDEVTWLIKFYFKKNQHISPVEITLAQGLGQLMSHQLATIAAEKLTDYIRDAELRNLQAQINPHFLFNTLHLIASMFRESPEKARHITVQLAQYMRFNLSLVSRSLVDIEKELEHVQAYVEIIQERFAGRMEIELNYPSSLPELKLPPSTLQPLVENSVKHGLKNTRQGGQVQVTIDCMTDKAFITVKDNGCGFSTDILHTVAKEPLTADTDGGSGLFNVNKRLMSLLGEESRLTITNLRDGGSEVSFSIPDKNLIKEEVYS